MRKVIKYLHGEEEARAGLVLLPLKHGAVDDGDLVGMAARLGRGVEVVVLHAREGGRDLNDVVAGAGVNLGVDGADVVEDVEHEGAAAGSHLVEDEVVVRVRREAVVRDEVAGNGLAVKGAEELGGRVP